MNPDFPNDSILNDILVDCIYTHICYMYTY